MTLIDNDGNIQSFQDVIAEFYCMYTRLYRYAA